MSKAVMISIKPEWCEKIFSGKKIIEVRKSKPSNSGAVSEYGCIPKSEFYEYLGASPGTEPGYDKYAFAWLIKDTILYDKPKKLSEFMIVDKSLLKNCPYRERIYVNPDYTNGALFKGTFICNKDVEPDYCRVHKQGGCADVLKPLSRPPQSWCYVEEVV